jgi:hypothetical protein
MSARLIAIAALLTFGLAAQSATRNVLVAWTPSSTSGVSYNVFRGATSAGPFAQLNASPISSLSYTDATPVIGQTYTYYVAAYLACLPSSTVCGSSGPGPLVSITVPSTPGASSSLTLTIP